MTRRPFQPPHGDDCPICHPGSEHAGLIALAMVAAAALLWWFA